MKLFGSTIFAIGLLAGCASGNDSHSNNENHEGEEHTHENETSHDNTQNPSDNNNIIEVSAVEMEYTPSSITLEEGKEYTLILKNEGEVFHDLTAKKLDVDITYMDDMPDHPTNTSFIEKIFGVKKALASGGHGDDDHGTEGAAEYIHMNANPGQTVKIKFIPNESGEFKFFCSVPGHEDAGMHGGFNIE
ncbi:plastocyanin/azurin family copper-binding protein [Bacillus sp. SCS-153A]|uniref:plastocyanin/azurin family copper-binding protein n=1 Tax=Rossellomorea sedimentorum TaxID=3115294 RepID=UPI00390634EF